LPQLLPPAVGVLQPPVPLHVLVPVTHEYPAALLPTHWLDVQLPVPFGGYAQSVPPVHAAPHGAVLLKVHSLSGVTPVLIPHVPLPGRQKLHPPGHDETVQQIPFTQLPDVHPIDDEHVEPTGFTFTQVLPEHA